MIDAQTSFSDLAFIVCTALARSGQTAILSGGGAATIYAPEAYQSRDLDFIFEFWSSFEPSDKPLKALGFTKEGGLYRHPLTPFTIDFPPGQLAVGSDDITKWETLRNEDLLLHILSPTDCVRDRLAWFFMRTDYSALEQALGVATRHPIDLDTIHDWCRREGELPRYAIFKHRYDELMGT